MSAHSIEASPDFISDNDYHINSPLLDGKADRAILSIINTDIEGNTRDANNPDIGASEFKASAPSSRMSGTFEIGNNGDYKTINSAMDALIRRGVSGPVHLEIEDGTYHEQVEFKHINGANNNNRIYFESKDKDSSLVTITYTPKFDTNNYVIRYDRSSFVTLQNLTLKAGNTPFLGRILVVGGYSHDNLFRNNLFQGFLMPGTDATHYHEMEDIYFNEPLALNNTIENNRINNGTTGIYWYDQGGGTDPAYPDYGLKIINNIIKNFGVSAGYGDLNNNSFGISLTSVNSPVIKDNVIVSNSQTGKLTGINVEAASHFLKIVNNRISFPKMINGTGIRIYACHADSNTPGIIANNFIKATRIGISFDNANNQDVYYNSINVTNGIGFYVYPYEAPSEEVGKIMNNLFIVQDGYAFQLQYYGRAGTYSVFSDYNDYYTTGAHFISVVDTEYSNLRSLRNSTGMDYHSVRHKVFFKSSSDLHLISSSIGDTLLRGIPVTEVTSDIDGEARSKVAPYMGADENITSPLPAGTNISPKIIKPIPDLTYREDTGPKILTSDLYSNFNDPDGGNDLTFSTSFISGDKDISMNVQKANGKYELISNSTLNNFGSARFYVVARDLGKLSITDTVNVTVTPVNDQLTINLPDSITIMEDESFSFALLDSTKEVDTPDSLLTFHLSYSNSYTSFYAQILSDTLTGSAGSSGRYWLTVTVTDDSNASAQDSMLVIVNKNNLPILTLPDTLKVTADQDFNIPLRDYASDVETPDTLLNFSFSYTKSNSFYVSMDTATATIYGSGSTAGEYYIYVTVTDQNGGSAKDSTVIVVRNTTGVNDIVSKIPKTYYLSQNYPNPFHSGTEISFGMPVSGIATLKIYDLSGHEVAILINEFKKAGTHKIKFDASKLAKGVYFYQLSIKSGARNFVEIKKMILKK